MTSFVVVVVIELISYCSAFKDTWSGSNHTTLTLLSAMVASLFMLFILHLICIRSMSDLKIAWLYMLTLASTSSILYGEHCAIIFVRLTCDCLIWGTFSSDRIAYDWYRIHSNSSALSMNKTWSWLAQNLTSNPWMFDTKIIDFIYFCVPGAWW